MNKKIGIYIRKKFHKKRLRQFAFMMACIVVFCTTYALLLPAVTLEKTAECGLEEHQHEDSCYEDQLVCGQEESGEHRHSNICYQKVLACGKEAHVHSADCFQDKVLESAMDGDFWIDYTGEEAEDAGEESGTSLLEEAEDAGDAAVNEQAAGSALGLEAEEGGQEVEESAGAAETLSEDISGEEAFEEEQAFSDQLPQEDAGEAQTLSEETAGGEVGSDEENSAEEADAAENQFSEEGGFEEGENLTEETEETVGEETGLVEDNPAGESGSDEESPAGETGSDEESPAGETGSVEEDSAGETGSVEGNSSEETETTQEQSSVEEAAGEAEPSSEETFGETLGENAGATTEQTAPDEMTEAEAAPVQGVAADLACQGQDYEVTVTAGEEAGIPEGASLSVSEIMPETSANNTDTDDNTGTELTYEEYVSRTGEALGLEEVSDYYIRLFDIKIVDSYGEKIKIQAPVDVNIQLTDQEGSNVSNAQIVHFADEADETDITEETNGIEETNGAEGEISGTEEASRADGEINGTESAYGADSINQAEGTDSESVTTPAGRAKKALKARKTEGVKKAQKAEKAGKEKKADVIQNVTVESGRAPEEGTTLSFEANGFSVFAVVGTTIEKNVLASDGHNYKVTVTYGPETEIPENADLAVEEITEGSSAAGKSYEDYVTYTENALGMEEGSTGYIRLFDISIVDKDDPEIKYQPVQGSSVAVRVELADSSSDRLDVVHFSDGSEEGEKLQSSTENGENGSAVEFQADGFSVYSIVDAPEPVPVYETVSTLDEIEENQEYYLAIARSGTNYMTSTTVLSNGNSGTVQLKGDTNRTSGENWFFERPEDGKVNIYYLDPDNNKMYLNVDDARNISFSDTPQPLSIEQTKNNAGTFYIYTVIGNKNYALSVRGNRNFFFEQRDNGKDPNERVVLTKYMNDPYKLDGKTFGIAYHDNSAAAAAMSATSKTVNSQNRLEGVDLLMRADVLNNKGILLVAENSDIQEWTFESAGEDKYYIKTTVEGEEKYLSINGANVTLVDSQADASKIQAMPGSDENSGKWHFTVNNRSLNFSGSAANGFNAATGSGATTWLNLVEKSTLSDDDFVEYSARKISASDDILSATEKDDRGNILIDDDGNPVYKPKKTKVVIYTRVWNETTKKYEFYAVDHDGSLVRVYESGDQINWVGNQVNSALWEFTEYTNTDGTPTYFYELENTAYAGKYLAPQSDSIISDQPVGINLNGRREGYDYTSIIAWDDPAYAYSGLKIERDEDGSLRVVTCPLEEAADFHFAVITPPVEEADPVTTVETVDNEEFGISIKMIDFNHAIVGNRDTVQTSYLGSKAWDAAHAYEAETGLVSTNLENGYPRITAPTEMNGESLSGLFNNMAPANHLFIQSVYNESGYFEYDSTQNFAHYNTEGDEAGNFTVYNQLGAIGTDTRSTRVHGQFMPYNDISAETGYAHDSQGNLITNQRNIRGEELPDTDPRKGEPLYLIPQNNADYYFGMELSAVFTQTPDGVDNWGHDIIFEFTGDDDFWFYVDGELVLDLGGVHSALGGSVNFRTGEVISNGVHTTLYDVFKSNYEARGGAELNKLDEIFVTKEVNGQTVHVFSDYTTHEMKMFYMERGAGASNLKMRFNLASVKPGTVELSKKLKGGSNASNKLIQYPYQIWYQTADYQQNDDGTYVLDENGHRVITHYHTPVLLSQPPANTNLTGRVYAVYKGTKKLIPFRESMKIGGITYNNVFLLRAGETAVINFPENTYRYKLVECGVDTAVYQHVYVNGDERQNEIFGKAYNNTDGWGDTNVPETPPKETTTYEGTTRSDFGITYYTTEGRPRVEYTNEVPPEVMRTLSFEKVLYDTNGVRLTDEQAAQIKDAFTFRLYLGNEFAEQENLLPADMYTYYIKGPDHNYCKWDKANKKFVSLGVNTFDAFNNLSEADRQAGTFTTSMYGAISKIPAGYTVEVRDLIVGTKYKVDEPDREIPKGYTRRDSDGYVRMDLAGGPVVYYTDQQGAYGRHPEQGNKKTAEAISDTIADKTESPNIEIRNQQGWGLTAKKEWTDKDFIIHDPIYMAVYLDEGNGNLRLIDGTVRMLNTNDTEIYWFFPDLKIDDEPKTFDKFIVREVELTVDPEGTPATPDTLTIDEKGVVTGYTGITPVDHGGSISVKGKTYSGTDRTENYTVTYATGESTGQNTNIRTDTVKNSRPGIQIYKTDWTGNNYLSRAVFTLKDSSGHDVGHASYTSDGNGLVTTAYLNEGTFTLEEIKTPSGYTALDEPITITVTTTQPADYDLTVTSGITTYYITVSGPEDFYTTTPATETDMARITVRNRTVQELKVIKEGVDGSTRTPLSGVHFALYDQVKDNEGNVRPAYNPKTGYEDIVTKDGGLLEEITISLGAGTYYLREKAAPSGYKKLVEDLCFTIGADGTVRINNAGYSNWLTRDTSTPGAVSYQISIENTPLGITVRKTDETGEALPGSKFVLYQKNKQGIFVIVHEYGLGEEGLIDLTDRTEMTFSGMSNGTYKLSETNAPSGYIILTKDIYFSLSDGTMTLIDEDGNAKTYTDVSLLDDNTTIAVKNNPGPALPSTGGPGNRYIHILGLMMTAGAGLLLWKKKRLL